MTCVRSQNLDSGVLPTWAGARSLLTKESLSLLQVGYLPFISYPVTGNSIVYTAMQNFVCLAGHLDQALLSVCCDEGVFRIVFDIFVRCSDEFKSLLSIR